MQIANKQILIFMFCFIGPVFFFTPNVFSQDSTAFSETVDQITVSVPCYFGRPNPTLVITNPKEIQYILDEVKGVDDAQESCEKVFNDPRYQWYGGVTVELKYSGKTAFFKISRGIIIFKDKCSPRKNEKIMKYLAERVLGSEETQDQLSADMKEKVRKSLVN
jgi:hypothetical protein